MSPVQYMITCSPVLQDLILQSLGARETGSISITVSNHFQHLRTDFKAFCRHHHNLIESPDRVLTNVNT